MTSVRRSGPLRAPSHDDTAPRDAVPSSLPPDPDAIVHEQPVASHTEADRRAFAEAVRTLRAGTSSLNLSERTLMVIGGILAPIGLLVVTLGWVGASRTPNLYEQVPYLISGGLLGLGLVFLGAFLYFAHWMTELVKEHRSASSSLLEAIARLQDSLDQQRAPDPVAHAGSDNGNARLVATATGSMAHRPDCIVVAGKDGLLSVDIGDGMAPCKLCDPYDDV